MQLTNQKAGLSSEVGSSGARKRKVDNLEGFSTPSRNTRIQTMAASTITRSKTGGTQTKLVESSKKRKPDSAETMAIRALNARMIAQKQMDLKAKKRQQKQAAVMEKRYDDAAPTVQRGSFVSVGVDFRDRKVQNSRKVRGVVLTVTSLHSITVITTDGILSENGRIAYIPSEQYHVGHELVTVDKELKALQELVLQGKEPKDKMIPRPTVHMNQHGFAFMHKCGCKTKKCGANCGCRKRDKKCGSGCACAARAGNCGNS